MWWFLSVVPLLMWPPSNWVPPSLAQGYLGPLAGLPRPLNRACLPHLKIATLPSYAPSLLFSFLPTLVVGFLPSSLSVHHLVCPCIPKNLFNLSLLALQGAACEFYLSVYSVLHWGRIPREKKPGTFQFFCSLCAWPVAVSHPHLCVVELCDCGSNCAMAARNTLHTTQTWTERENQRGNNTCGCPLCRSVTKSASQLSRTSYCALRGFSTAQSTTSQSWMPGGTKRGRRGRDARQTLERQRQRQ